MRHPFDGIISYEEMAAKSSPTPVQPTGPPAGEPAPARSPSGCSRRSILRWILGSAAVAVGMATGRRAEASPPTSGGGPAGSWGGVQSGPGGGETGAYQGLHSPRGPQPPSSPGSFHWPWRPPTGAPGQVTTYALGEESGRRPPGYSWRYPYPGHGGYTTQALGEEGGGYTTRAFGEEGGHHHAYPQWPLTRALGEEGVRRY